jgi:hypothetical protein
MIPQKMTPEQRKRAQLMLKGIWVPPGPSATRAASQKLGQQKIAEMTKGKPPTVGN